MTESGMQNGCMEILKIILILAFIFINLAIITISIIHCIPLRLLYSFILKLTQKWPVRAISNWPFPFYFFSIFFLSRLIFLLFIKRKKKFPGLFYMLSASALKLGISPKFLVPLIGECILKSKIWLLAVFTPIDWVCT